MANDDYAQEFDAVFAHMARRARSDRFIPNVDVYVDAAQTRVFVQLEAAGTLKDSLAVAADDRMLYIRGLREPQGAARDGICAQKEIEYGDFERKIHLPFPIDTKQAVAQFDDGILTIELPARTSDIPTIIETEIRLIFRRTTR